MKYNAILLVLFSIMICSFVNAQNVGIDEPNPSEKLDVNGRIVAKGYKNTIVSIESSDQLIISSSAFWVDIPDFSVTFNLAEATTIIASYNIPLFINGDNSPFHIRLLIDAIETPPYSGRFGGDYDVTTITGQHIIELGAGSHTVKAQYWNPQGAIATLCQLSQSIRSLQVLVFGEAN